MSVAMHLSVRLLIVGLAGLSLAWLVFLHLRREESHPRVIAALAVVVAVLGTLEYRAQGAEKRYGGAVSEVAKRDVSVRCQGVFGNLVDIGQELGTVQFDAEGEPADVTNIKRDACKWLKEWEKSGFRTSKNAAVAVHVLSHEGMHLRGWTSEAVAECYGLQHSATVAQKLGASAQKAQALAKIYWDFVYPNMPAEYTTPECGNGERLDLHKDSDVWPSGLPGLEPIPVSNTPSP